MDYQILVNIAVGIGTLMGGWIFKMIMGHINEIKSDHNELMKKHHEDIEKISLTYVEMALSLPEKYVSKEDFKMFSERMNDRFDRIEEKLDNMANKFGQTNKDFKTFNEWYSQNVIPLESPAISIDPSRSKLMFQYSNRLRRFNPCS